MVDAAIRYRLDRFTVSLNAKNLLDEEYYTGGGVRSVFAGEPRTVQATITTAF